MAWKEVPGSARCGIRKQLRNGNLYLKNNPQKLALIMKTV
jgi:hypothetical protein